MRGSLGVPSVCWYRTIGCLDKHRGRLGRDGASERQGLHTRFRLHRDRKETLAPKWAAVLLCVYPRCLRKYLAWYISDMGHIWLGTHLAWDTSGLKHIWAFFLSHILSQVTWQVTWPSLWSQVTCGVSVSDFLSDFTNHLDPSHLAYFGTHPIVFLMMHCWRRHASASMLFCCHASTL